MKKCILTAAALCCVLACVLHAAAGAPILLGDADRDDELTILDATKIQRVIAEMEGVPDSLFEVVSDADGDGSLTILDATRIQRTLAELCNIDGSVPFDSAYPPQYIQEATQPPTGEPTEAPGKPENMLAAPRITAIESTNDGLKLTWEPVDGAERYRVFVFRNEEWLKIGDTEDSFFIYNTPAYNTFEFFTVRCVSADGTYYTSDYDTHGTVGKYLNTPIIRFESSGLTVNYDGDLSYYAFFEWSSTAGADAYEVYYKTKSENKWHLYRTLTAADNPTMYDFSGAPGESYSFAVRGVAHNGNKIYRSAYLATEWQDALLETPVCTGAYFMPKWVIENGNYTPADDDQWLNFQWEPVAQFTRPNINYRVYIREDGVWRKLNDNGVVSYCIYDTGEGGGHYGTYEFAVRIMTGDKKTFVSAPGFFRITYSPDGLSYENVTE